MSNQTFRTFSIWARGILGAVICVAILGIAADVKETSAAPNIPQYFNYQGRLMSSSGVNVVDGTYAIKYSLYSTASGGMPIWTASGTTAVPVALNMSVTNGLFTILLGDTTFQGQNAMTGIDWNQDGLYLGITVGVDSEMTPRKKLSSVPFAFNAGALQGNYASSSVAAAGGSLFSIHQTTADAAVANRTALSITTEGTSDQYDLLIRGANSSGDVFTVSRLGNVTTTGLAFTNASGSSLLISGKNVCLADGTNCQAGAVPIGSYVWSDNSTNGTIYNTTATRDVLIGGSTTATAGFIFDSSTNGTSTVVIGGATNTNLFVGTSTYSGELDSNFTLNGNDVFVLGQLGSVGGLFSATGVTVGTGSTIYGDGNLYKTNAGDFTFALNNSASNWRFRTGGQESFTVASSGKVGIGVTTPLEALDVSGTIRNIFREGQSFSVLGSTALLSTAGPNGIAVSGRYAYTANYDNSTVNVIDVSVPNSPVIVGTSTLVSGAIPYSIYVSGKYAYTANAGNQTVNIIDISNPSFPTVVGTSTLGAGVNPTAIFVSGRYAYAYSDVGDRISIIDVSNPTSPAVIGTKLLSYGSGGNIYVQDRYAYVTSFASGTMNIIDVSNPAQPAIVSTSTLSSGTGPLGIYVSGRYAYTSNYSNDTVNVLDVSNPALPMVVGTSTLSAGADPANIFVSGRYAYTANWSNSTINVIDVAIPTSPVVVGTSTLTGAGPFSISVSGKYAYSANYTNDTVSVIDLKGIETSSLLAHSAELGSLSVLSNANISNQLTIGGSLVVGPGGILSQGSLAISSTNTTSTFVFAVSSSYAEISNRLTVGGKNVCLADGTNCQAGAVPIGSYVWSDNLTNGTIYNTTATRDVLIGGSTTATAGFIFDKEATTSSLIIGSYTGNANLLVGTTTYGGGLNSNFALNGNDVFVQGMLGSQEGLFSATGVTVGTNSTIYGDGNLYKTNAGDFTFALNNSASNWRFRTGGQESFTVASSGKVGIGVTTPLEALDVSGTIQSIYQENSVLDTLSTTYFTSGHGPNSLSVSGRYGYVLQGNVPVMNVVDLSNPASPVIISTTTFAAASEPDSLVVSGRYAYVASNAPREMYVVDISNPSAPITVSTSTLTGSNLVGIQLSGNHLYVIQESSRMTEFDISNPRSPKITAVTLFTNGTTPSELYVSEGYGYVVTEDNYLFTVDLVNKITIQSETLFLPIMPVVATSTVLGGSKPNGLFVQGGYAYVADSGNDVLEVIDVTDVYSPLTVATTSLAAGAGPYSVTVSGRYAFVPNLDDDTLNVIDVSRPAVPRIVSTVSMPAGSWPRKIVVSGRYGYLLGYANDTLVVLNLKGTETSALAAHTAEIGSLQVLDDAVFANRLSVNGGLSVGVGGILSMGSLSVSASNTTSTFVYAVSTTNAMVSNRLNVGGNVLVGTSTYGGGLDSNFTVNGNDLLVQGKIGSLDGLYSATGVTVGTGSTIFGDGNLYKTTSGDFTLALNNAASNWRFRTGGQESFTVASSGFIGIGVATPLEALDVSGTIRNILRSGQSFSVVTSTQTLATPKKVVVSGKYAYVTAAGASDRLQVFDVSDASSPTSVGSVAVGDNPIELYVSGRYAYVLNQAGNSMSIVDISIPSSPSVVGAYPVSSPPWGVQVSGKYAYMTWGGTLDVVDISKPSEPVKAGSVFLGGGNSYSIAIQGRYAYISANSGASGFLKIVDISDPAAPVSVTSSLVNSGDPRHIEVRGRYAYLSGNDGNATIVDISNPNNPRVVSAISGQNFPYGNAVRGRYWYLRSNSSGNLRIYDVASSTAPSNIASQTIAGSAGEGLDVSGRYLYTTAETTNELVIIDIEGVETNGLISASAEIGSLQILGNGHIANDLTVGSALNVGTNGIYSQGALSVYTSSTNSTSTMIHNSASNTAPLLQIVGGCDNGSTSTDLLLAGNATDIRKFSVRCNGTVAIDGTYNTGGADYAEYFAKDPSEDMAPGTAVVAVNSIPSLRVKGAMAADRAATVGIVSTLPGFLGNDGQGRENDPGYVAVALSGQVPASAVGPIVVGDELMVTDGGRVAKAVGPGMIVGTAMSPLISGDGTVQVLVRPQWWAGDFLTTDGEARFMHGDTTIRSRGAATAATTTYDSSMFSFEGSVYDENSATAHQTTFSLWNESISASSSLFHLGFATGTNSRVSMLTISNLGDLNVTGDLTVGRRLFLGSKMNQSGSTSTYIYVDDTLAPSSTYIATNADGWSTSSTYDYAERYFSDDGLSAGELVAIDTHNPEYVKRTNGTSDVAVGIVSTKPGFVTGGYMKDTYPIALAGRVPTKVIGPVKIGDPIMASDVPGFGKAADSIGFIVGYALEAHQSPDQGLVSVFIQPGWSGFLSGLGDGEADSVIDGGVAAQTQLPGRSGLAKIFAGSREVTVRFLDMGAYPLIQATPYGEARGGFWVKNVGSDEFIIEVAEAPTFDLVFAWSVSASVLGNNMSFSDNTQLPYDPTSGIVYGPILPPEPIEDMASSTESAEVGAETATTTTSTVESVP